MGDATHTSRFSGRAFLAWIAILGLAAAVIWLASERNAHQYALVPEGGRIVVKKGMFLPIGQRPFIPRDPALAAAYAPISPPPGSALPEEQAFYDKSSLDQALYALLARWAREEIAAERPELLERALGYLSRADRLAGISAAQRDDLRAIRAESGWFEGRELLERGADALRQAREKLRMAADSSTRHAGEAQSLLRQVEPLADETSRLSRSLAPEPAAKRESAPPEATAPAPSPAAPDGGSPKRPEP